MEYSPRKSICASLVLSNINPLLPGILYPDQHQCPTSFRTKLRSTNPTWACVFGPRRISSTRRSRVQKRVNFRQVRRSLGGIGQLTCSTEFRFTRNERLEENERLYMPTSTAPKSNAVTRTTPQALALTSKRAAGTAPSQAKLVKWFSEIGIEDIPLVGGKNASLGEMYRELTPKEGDTGLVYDGRLPFEVQRTNLKDLGRPRTKVLMNVGNPEEAFSLSFIPNDGVGLAREEFI